ncbi:hypothetical protein CDAR_281521 [Caerostris darwini]|uniref:Uncharacterized protein n=1 Tax=Caerostris darwini TaxID=1538125 RepID=A0AAV4R0X0_9ARAC|nr:hypothetical protein CDAR_281521 [Caerostris darwini]
MALRVSQIQCAASEHGLLRNNLGRRWSFSRQQNIKWNSISTFPNQKKERKFQSNSILVYSSEMESSPLKIQLAPPQIRCRDPPRDSIHSQHVFPYIRKKWENGREDVSTSGHSGKLKVSGFNVRFRTGVALELFVQKVTIFSSVEHKMQFNQYFSRAEKRTKTPVEQHSSVLRNGKLSPYFQPLSPL